MKRQLPPPPVCLITRFNDAGEIVAVEEVTRSVTPRSEWKSEIMRMVRNFRVMARQETGEEHLVGYARTRAQGNAMADGYMMNHPEHTSWVERNGE